MMASSNNRWQNFLISCWLAVLCGCTASLQSPTPSSSLLDVISGVAGEKSNEPPPGKTANESPNVSDNNTVQGDTTGVSSRLRDDQSNSATRYRNDAPTGSLEAVIKESNASELPPSKDAAKTNSEIQAEFDRQLQKSIVSFQRQLEHSNQSPVSKMPDSTGTPSVSAKNNHPIDSPRKGLVPVIPSSRNGGLVKGDSMDRWNRVDLGNGYDEVVARQLHSAAENETDPVLRNRLFEEYRRYTNTPSGQD